MVSKTSCDWAHLRVPRLVPTFWLLFIFLLGHFKIYQHLKDNKSFFTLARKVNAQFQHKRAQGWDPRQGK